MYIYNKLNTLKLNSGPIHKNSRTSNYIPQCSPEILPSTVCTRYAPISSATWNPNEPNPYAILISTLCVEGYEQIDQINGSYVCAMEVRSKWRAPMIVLCTKVEPLPFGRKGLKQMNPPPLWCQRGGTNKAFHNLIATAADTVKFQMCSLKLWNSRSSLEHICNCSWHGNHSDVYNPGTTLKLNQQHQS